MAERLVTIQNQRTACPYCGAERGEPCVVASWWPRAHRRAHYTHAARKRAAELFVTTGDEETTA